MQGVIADSAGGAWTFGGSILTFAFPMILFIVVAGALYVLYTKPEFVPGHRPGAGAAGVLHIGSREAGGNLRGTGSNPGGQAGPAAEDGETDRGHPGRGG